MTECHASASPASQQFPTLYPHSSPGLFSPARGFISHVHIGTHTRIGVHSSCFSNPGLLSTTSCPFLLSFIFPEFSVFYVPSFPEIAFCVFAVLQYPIISENVRHSYSIISGLFRLPPVSAGCKEFDSGLFSFETCAVGKKTRLLGKVLKQQCASHVHGVHGSGLYIN